MMTFFEIRAKAMNKPTTVATTYDAMVNCTVTLMPGQT